MYPYRGWLIIMLDLVVIRFAVDLILHQEKPVERDRWSNCVL